MQSAIDTRQGRERTTSSSTYCTVGPLTSSSIARRLTLPLGSGVVVTKSRPLRLDLYVIVSGRALLPRHRGIKRERPYGSQRLPTNERERTCGS